MRMSVRRSTLLFIPLYALFCVGSCTAEFDDLFAESGARPVGDGGAGMGGAGMGGAGMGGAGMGGAGMGGAGAGGAGGVAGMGGAGGGPTNTAPSLVDQVFFVAENSLAGAVVGTVVAADPDGDNLTYSLIAGNALGAFAMDPATGEITVANAGLLDYETNPAFSLTAEVKDDGVGNLTTTATITIAVEPPPVLLLDFDSEGAIDQSGYGTPCVINGPMKWIALGGHAGTGAYQFDAVKEYIECQSSPVTEITQHITLATWIKPSAFGGTAPLVGKWTDSSPQRSYLLTFGFAGQPNSRFLISPNGNYSNSYDEFTPSGSLNLWTHVAGTYDGNVMKIYVNGVAVLANFYGAPPHNPGTIFNSTTNITIGAYDNYQFAGLIDDVRIYKSALSPMNMCKLAGRTWTANPPVCN